MRFTKAAIESLTLPKGKSEWIAWDDSLPGFESDKQGLANSVSRRSATAQRKPWRCP